ncbi:HD domain-containing phosphohydrolase [Chitinimonas taiwanensis]|uniref:HD domain-containing phosphohydrolase n=1 Tax=Chitinimonas taiwanensis TaxID=240412 RepID=UPI0035B2F530
MSLDGTQPVQKTPHRSYPLRVHIATLFTLLILLTGLSICWYAYWQNQKLALQLAQARFSDTARGTAASLEGLHRPTEALVNMLAALGKLSDSDTLPERLDGLGLLSEALRSNPQLVSLYAGYSDGDFFLLRRLADVAARERFAAPREAAFLVQSVERAGAEQIEGRYLFLSDDLRILSDEARPDYRFDPRGRPWYQLARSQSGLVRTEPYAFFTTGEVGLTFARRSDNGRVIVAADLTLSRLSAELARASPTPSAELALVDARQRVLAYRDPARLLRPESGQGAASRLSRLQELPAPVLRGLAAQLGKPQAQAGQYRAAGGRDWLYSLQPLTAQGAQRSTLMLAVPLDELFAEARRVRDRTVLATLLILALSLPLTWWLSHRIGERLRALSDEAKRIQRFQFDGEEPPPSPVHEVDMLGQAIGKLKRTIQRFLDISQSLAEETQFDRLLDRVLLETIGATGAEGGAIYLLDEASQTLKPAAMRWQDAALGVAELQPIALDAVSNPLAMAVRERTTELLALSAPREPSLAYVDAHFGLQPVLMIAPPLANRSGELVGVLCLFLPGDSDHISPARAAFVEALSDSAAVAIENQRLLQGQKDLLEAFIKLIAGAIDAKSPYTGGHCQRVPELTKALAEAAHRAEDGPFKEYRLSASEREALHIACWLHDCGKVTTPEFVVDKATKLETLYDRIHEVRMRFEVLKRDAEIAYWRELAQGGDALALAQRCQHEQAQLDEEFAFVAQCNLGGEQMSAEQLARLGQIAQRQWLRTLDDRLGVSWEEAQRMAAQPTPELPVLEPLLADKPAHRIARKPHEQMPADNPWGFKLSQPEYKFDRGELHNLSVRRGTLSEEDRYLINDHIVQTIIMLSRLPFPKHLQRVPEIAGGHHEKMDGGGYPKRLIRAQMSVEARMMAIADIFEALTAVDRPYKQGKRLSEAVAIMARMRDDAHIDAELFALFLRSGVHLDYARRFLRPEQIDVVDIEAYLTEGRA